MALNHVYIVVCGERSVCECVCCSESLAQLGHEISPLVVFSYSVCVEMCVFVSISTLVATCWCIVRSWLGVPYFLLPMYPLRGQDNTTTPQIPLHSGASLAFTTISRQFCSLLVRFFIRF
jgi:hypothetical protein